MGRVYRKPYTRPLPANAEIAVENGKRIARWKQRNGKLGTGEVIEGQDGTVRVRGRSPTYTVRYRDAAGRLVEKATGLKDRTAARIELASLEKQVERVRAGVLAPEECRIADHAAEPLAKHLDEYQRHLRARKGNARRIKMLRSRIDRIARECRITQLGRLTASAVEQWLVRQAEYDMSSTTRNGYREALIGFGRWCCNTHRLAINPFTNLTRAEQEVDRRHQRRALTTEELSRLLEVASKRPLAEYGRTVIKKERTTKPTSGSRATWNYEPLEFESLDIACQRARRALKGSPAKIEMLERTGRERRLIYLTLVSTGLRKGELASLTAGQLTFDGPVAYAALDAADAKNRKCAGIPLRKDLATELRTWLKARLVELQAEARAAGKPIPMRLPPGTRLFNVPSGLTRIFDRDLAVAGIPKRDERNRVVDVHALRMTFCSHLCAAGVPLRTAQVAMRHSKPELTARVYSDPHLLDVAGAVASLPAFGSPRSESDTAADS